MSCLPEKIFGTDTDLLFSYPTTKFVRIQDRRLGLFKYLMTFFIVAYVAVYQLAYQCMYLYQSGVSGAVRFTLQQPTDNGCDPTNKGCKNEFSNTNELDYCTESPLEYATGNKYPCQFFENIGAQVVMDSSLLAATRVTTYDQYLACNATTQATCPYVYNTSYERTQYVVDAEQFTVLVDHSVLAASIPGLQVSSSDAKGRLLVSKGSNSLCVEFESFKGVYGDEAWVSGDCYLKPNETSRSLDYFSLDVLLRAAGATLDTPNYGGETYRETGVTMLLKITYENYKPWKGKGDVYYSYEPFLVKGSSYKHYDSVYGSSGGSRGTSYRDDRTLLNKHGVFIEAVQQGSLRDFNFNNLLIQLTTSLTLFAVATVIVDFFAMYVLPDHEVYEAYKYELTEDFSDRRDNLDNGAQAAGGEQQQQQSAPDGAGVGMMDSHPGSQYHKHHHDRSAASLNPHADRNALHSPLLDDPEADHGVERRFSGTIVHRKD